MSASVHRPEHRGFTADKLFALLPAILRVRDTELALGLPLLTTEEATELAALEGLPSPDQEQRRRVAELRAKREHGPLWSLLSVIAEQVGALEENLEQLYDDQFIETCADWATPYLGDLIGYRPLHGIVPGVASPRAEVANTIAFRRRKGTAAMLEQLARDVTGWPARVVEFFELVSWTQYMNHVRSQAHQAPDLRRLEHLLWVNTPFDGSLHTIDVRRIRSGAGRYNIPNIGLFLWRVRAFSLTRSPAPSDPVDPSGRLLRFDPLGCDTQLYTQPQTEEEIAHLAEPINLPHWLSHRWLATHLTDYYGFGKSFWIELAGDPPTLVPASSVRVCNLANLEDAGGNVIGWAHASSVKPGEVAVDPVLGRLVFGSPPETTVLASFHHGFTLEIGGGEYERGEVKDLQPVQQVGGGAALQPALDAVAGGGVVEILDSRRYAGPLTLAVNAGKTLVLRAANGARPLLAVPGDATLDLERSATLVLDGLVILGGAVRMATPADTESRQIVLRHCTLVPGIQLAPDGTPSAPGSPSLIVPHAFAAIELDRCIVGPLHVAAGATVSIRDSIVDATAPDLVAYRGSDGELLPGAALTVEQSTVIGKVHAREITLASNSLFVARLEPSGETWKAPVWAERLQTGCVRFSFVPPGSRTPRRFRCQPDGADEAHVRPHFTSLRYGDAGYGQLSAATAAAIRRGADDESEMGVMHDLFQPQRETNLRVRLEEYLRFGLEAGLFYAS